MLEGCIVDDYFSTSWKCGAHDWYVVPLRNVVCIFMNNYFDTSWKCGAHSWDEVPLLENEGGVDGAKWLVDVAHLGNVVCIKENCWLRNVI